MRPCWDDAVRRRFDRALARLREQGPALFDGRPVRFLEPGARLSRPFSDLLWVRVHLEDDSRVVVVVKSPRLRADRPDRHAKVLGRLAREAEVSAELGRRLATERELGVARVLAWWPDVPALVMPEIPGENVADLIARLGRWPAGPAAREQLETACRGAGRLLRAFQRVTTSPGAVVSLDDVWRAVELRIERLADLAGPAFDASWRRDVSAAFDRAAREASPDDLAVTGVHGDFAPGNVIADGHRAVLIDLSTLQSGSVWFDLTRFDHQLGLIACKPGFDGTIARLQHAFREGCGGVDRDAPLFRLFTIQHVLSHWLGSVKRAGGRPLHERVYDRWVLRAERRRLRALVGGEQAA
jgi:Ser/Thr protein kinase RdoA (MazF antagonist)